MEALQLLTEFARELQGAPTFSQLLELVARYCASILGTKRASLRLLDPSGTKLLAVCRSGRPLHTDPSEPFEVGEGLIGWIVENALPLRAANAEADPRFVPRAGQKERLESFLGVPLVAGEQALGVVSAVHEGTGYFTEQHEQQLTLLAGIAAPHIEIARRDFVVRDPLTGLFNHAYFHQMLGREIERSLVYGLPFSLLLVDVDGFKRINEERGPEGGDALLRQMAEILKGRGDRSDGGFRLRGQDAVARFGGDEYAIVLPHTPKASGIAKADHLRGHIAGYDFSGLDLARLTVSVVVASVPDDAYDRAGLLAAAERSLRAAKRQGGNRTVGHSRALAVAQAIESSHHVDIDKFVALEETIDKRRIDYAYQPIVDVTTGELLAYEALCRPQHDSFDGPAELFEIAEHAGRVVELGRVCRTVSTVPLAGLAEPCLLFLNLHPRELDDVALLGERAIKEAASRFVFEITETAAIEDYERVRSVIDRLRDHGCRIALDDLGSGYAGLNSLAQLQPDFVKLDMALIRRIHVKSSTRRLVKHILEFCRGEEIPVISEGVETAEEFAEVRAIGCPFVQGDYIAAPGPPFPSTRSLT